MCTSCICKYLYFKNKNVLLMFVYHFFMEYFKIKTIFMVVIRFRYMCRIICVLILFLRHLVVNEFHFLWYFNVSWFTCCYYYFLCIKCFFIIFGCYYNHALCNCNLIYDLLLDIFIGFQSAYFVYDSM